MKNKTCRVMAFTACLSLLFSACGQTNTAAPENTSVPETTAAVTTAAETTSVTTSETTSAATTSGTTASSAEETKSISVSEVSALSRPRMISDELLQIKTPAPTKKDYLTYSPDLSDVYFGMNWVSDEEKELLAKNGFVIGNSAHGEAEFFQAYELNRYLDHTTYVTTDSLLHTYHLYFQHLMKKSEKEHLIPLMKDVSIDMLKKSGEHYTALKGTEWENAARMELEFFAVGAALIDPSVTIPPEVSDEVSAELKLIDSAAGIDRSNIFPDKLEDYSQYKPRGYYDETNELKQYFRAMMWYGRMGFKQKDDDCNRAALLMTLGLEGETLEKWEKVYTVTSFFAGDADDYLYYEYRPIIDAVYGRDITAADLAGKDAEWTQFTELAEQVPPPKIYSVVVSDDMSDEEKEDEQKGYRFMGQRFSLDEAAFTQLCYHTVEKSADDRKRLLPDPLDFPAALGSDTALDIIRKNGNADYPNYEEQMSSVRSSIEQSPESTWSSSLYSGWIYTLRPLLEEKGEDYPPFMRTEAWRKRSLITFEGSYTELKHDTVLYSKQFMGEMGGGWDPPDDRGYVEAEPLVFRRLEQLSADTKNGLMGYGMISDAEAKDLDILSELCDRLAVIAEKELAGELPTDDEFDLIRTIGGQLEHFWEEVTRADFPDEEFITANEHPVAIAADIATDPNGEVLEFGLGNVAQITVLVEVDGIVKLASGPVYKFYSLKVPLNERLDDSSWRRMIAVDEVGEDENGWSIKKHDPRVVQPEWTEDIWLDVWYY
ncbi:MAG: DUF3160 domain-containing protein [Oscillospiraceae bacterium]|nr:DUF3160 domain-containing protein [Oscillospiraceae bacterium]